MKVSIDKFYEWCAEADEYQLIVAKAKLLVEINGAERMLWAVNKRLEYLDFINPENCVLLAKSLGVDSPAESD